MNAETKTETETKTKTKTKFIALNSLNIVTRFHAQFSVQKKVLTNVDNVCVIYETQFIAEQNIWFRSSSSRTKRNADDKVSL